LNRDSCQSTFFWDPHKQLAWMEPSFCCISMW
jgi:hypothetical protein